MCSLISSILGCCLQDPILVIPPYPYCIEEVPHDVPLEDCWYACPQLRFTCTFVQNMEEPRRIQLTDTALMTSMSTWCLVLVFFSTFEELKLPISGPMASVGVTKLYEPSLTPCLYVAPAANNAQHGGQSSSDPLVPGW